MSKGLRGLLGPNPVFSMGVGQGSPWMSRQLVEDPLMAVAASTRCQLHIRSNFGVQYLAQGYFDMELSPALGSRDNNIITNVVKLLCCPCET